MSVIHKKHSTAVGTTDPSKVHPSDWNDEHVNADGTPVTALRMIVVRVKAVGGAIIKVADLDAGTMVLRPAVLAENDLVIAEGAIVTLAIGDADGATDYQDLAVYDAWNDIVNGYDDKFFEFTPLEAAGSLSNASRVVELVEDQSVFLAFGGFFTGGHVRLVLIVADPA